MLFFIVYSYLNSLKRDDELHAKLIDLKKRIAAPGPAVTPTPTGQEPAKAKVDWLTLILCIQFVHHRQFINLL